MLLEKCRTLKTSLDQLEAARQEQQLAESLNQRAQELNENASTFEAVSQIVNVLLEAQILRSTKLPDDSKAIARVAAMREQLATEPREITKGQSFSLMRRAVEKVSTQLEQQAKEVWDEYVKTTAPRVEPKQLKHHREFPRLADVVYRIERDLKESSRLARVPPSSRESLQTVMDCWDSIRELVRQLPVTDEPEIQAFLDAAISQDGASIELLTATVREWLQENGMAGDFCIRQR